MCVCVLLFVLTAATVIVRTCDIMRKGSMRPLEAGLQKYMHIYIYTCIYAYEGDRELAGGLLCSERIKSMSASGVKLPPKNEHKFGWLMRKVRRSASTMLESESCTTMCLCVRVCPCV
jgi:hypothetical protein